MKNDVLIKVLWVDEDIINAYEYCQLAKKFGIDLVQFMNWDAASEALANTFKDWSAVILEPNSKLHSGSYCNPQMFLVHAFHDIAKYSERNNRKLPWYLLTDIDPMKFNDLVVESRKEFDEGWGLNYYSKEKHLELLFRRIHECVNRANNLLIKNSIYADVFESLDYLEENGLDAKVTQNLEDLLLSLHFGFTSETNYEKIRKSLEYIFHSMHNNGLVPFISGLGGINIFACCQVASGKTWSDDKNGITYVGKKVFDKLFVDIILRMLNVANAHLHADNNDNDLRNHYYIPDYSTKVNSNYLLHSLAIQLCDIIKYYDTILKKHKQDNFPNQWEEL